ncbi:hypothetical protein JL475_00350 [Streptomyces sp. M2CJ-2]|uniref:hypothetical protein n=1 Tax=Streptomyces sp. M2CJ-2 TaxID=2803948 RepID=UPI00192376BC|nr:hypothetical protein [Streptomyces sp. M2CJ-2]MBL3664496.1 hypothetical protein [Streptomyces sp. M2CJ-2]
MFRYIAWALLALYLLVVGLAPAALAPVTLALAGLAAVIAAIPGPVWLLAGIAAWLKHRPATPKPATA